MTFEAANVFPTTARVGQHGRLSIGGCDVVALSEEFGTPLYLFDEATLRDLCREFRAEFTSRHQDTRVVYAAKAYINLALAAILKEEGLGLDVVSGGELAVAIKAAMPPESIYFHGNNKGAAELQMALEYGVGRVVVDNFHELGILDGLASGMGRVQDILLRVSPGVDPHTHAHTTTGILDSKFGFPLQTGQAAHALEQALAAPSLNLVGLHFHLGSPIFETEPYQRALGLVLKLAAAFGDRGLHLQEISPGGGFAIRYTRDQEPPSIARYAETIASSLHDGCARRDLPLPRLVIEPGRAIVGPAGVALYTVGAIKDIPGVRKYVSVDGGMGDNIRPALYGAIYEAVVANRLDQAPTERVTIAGKFCESGDILVRDAFLPPVQAGDLIAIPASGAYCAAMASNYNLAPRPAVVLVRDGRARLIRRRETYDDLTQRDLF